jgi:tRNA pseudouridine38-40 synthase
LQETVENALAKILGMSVSVQASGRTDSGVHAFCQVCDFFLPAEKLCKYPKDLAWALRAHLPSAIVPYDFQLAPMEYHSTLWAIAKTYRYRIWNGPRENPFVRRYRWWIRRPLDLDFLNSLASQVVGEHDFKSFQSKGTPVRSTVRRIYRAYWRKLRPVSGFESGGEVGQARAGGLGETIEFVVTGNGFLKQMVRNLVGTQVGLFLDREPASKMGQILAARDRTRAGLAAPPQGLFLAQVFYPKTLDSQCLNL